MYWVVVLEVVFGCVLFWFFSFVGGVSLDFSLLGCCWFNPEFSFFFDFVGGVFFFMLFCCGVSALLFCVHYFSVNVWGLLGLMGVFLSVMLVLVFSSSFIVSLVFWEYLGFVSFLLILYYSNMESFRAALVTLVSSRFGDVGLFLVLCWASYDCGVMGGVIGVLLFLIVSSKSAGYPFVSWLIEAMRAPTPVSSLVHSSTLVAAGTWFILRYGVYFDSLSLWLVFLSSSLTIILSSFCACGVMDIKKVVALSTCNNISWCLLYYICGDVVLCVCQLLVHGLCKSLLFMCVGDLMISSGSSQSGVGFYSSPRLSWVNCFMCVLLVSFLCGLPFLGVFITKHVFLLGCLSNLGVSSFIFLFFAFFLTHVYSFRFLYLLFMDGGGLGSNYYFSFSLVSVFVWVVYLVDLVLGGLFEELIVSGVVWGLLILIVQLFGCWFGWIISCFGISDSFFVSRVFGCDSIVLWFVSLYHSLIGFLSIYLFRWEVSLVKWVIGFEFREVHFYGLGLSGLFFVVGVVVVFYVSLLF